MGKLALKLRICVRFASTFNVERVAVLTYDLVICKDSNDCLHVDMTTRSKTMNTLVQICHISLRTFASISITK